MRILLPLIILLVISFGCNSEEEETLSPVGDIKDAFLIDLEGDVNELTKLTDNDREDLIGYFKELKLYTQVHKQYPLHRARLLLIDTNQDTIILNGSPDSHSVVVGGEGTYKFDRKRTEQQFQLKLQTLLNNKK